MIANINSEARRTIYFANQSLPGSSAPSNHSIRTAKALVLAGYNSVLLVEEDHGAESDMRTDGTYACEGIPYVPVGKNTCNSNPFGKWGWFLGINQSSLQYLMKQEIVPVAVILQGPHFPVYMRFRVWCRRHGVALILESMEWNERSAYKGNIVQWLDAEFRMRVIQRWHGPIFIICEYLLEYYARLGGQAFLLPPLLDTQDPAWMPKNTRRTRSAIRLMFAGSPVRDRQDIILGAILRSKREGLNVTIEYLGSTRRQVEGMLEEPAIIDELGNAVVFHGRVPNEQVPVLMGQVDYAVLLREDARWSKACFPSKIPEFLSLGVPIICNITSDLSDYLQDGQEAFLVKEVSVSAFAGAIRRAAELANDEAYVSMREQARRTAVEAFDIRAFSGLLGNYIRRVSPRKPSRIGR